jgi:hypothetical protein
MLLFSHHILAFREQNVSIAKMWFELTQSCRFNNVRGNLGLEERYLFVPLWEIYFFNFLESYKRILYFKIVTSE